MSKAFITATVTGLILATMLPASNAAQAFPTSAAIAGTTTGVGNGALSSGAGSVAAAANSFANPSGNAFINTSPSGSTLMPNVGGIAGGGRRR